MLGAGAFGAARETGEVLNTAIRDGAARGIGIGQAVGETASWPTGSRTTTRACSPRPLPSACR